MDYRELYELEREKYKALHLLTTHDLASPLSAVNSYLELLLSGKIPHEQVPEILQKIKLNNLAAMEIIRSLRIDTKSREP